MSVFYDIKEDYNDNLYTFESMLNEPALEADAGTPDKNTDTMLNDDAHKTTNANGFVEKVKRIIDRFLQLIDTMILKIKNSFQKVYLTDKGFHKDVEEWRKTYKPITSVKLIVYQYDNQQLDSIFNHLKASLTNYMNAYHPGKDNDTNNILNYTTDQILQDLINRAGLKNDDDVTDGTTFLNEIKKEFRNKKVENTFVGASVEKYISIVEQYPTTKTLLNNELARMKQKLVQFKNQSNIIANKTDIPDEIKKKMNIQLSKLYFVYNFYAAFIRMYFELKVEEALMYRIIVRRLYQQ